jgi:FKBP-type peptidyl-prolyl cis-trans isomerase SlyD
MSITKNTLVTLDYRLSSPEGEELYAENDLMYLQGGYEQIFAKVEAVLEGKNVGDSVCVALSPSEAFGEYDDTLLVEEALSELPEGLSVGMEIDGYSEENPEEVTVYTVKEIRGNEAVLDGNHPLAGRSIVFEATVTETQMLDDAEAQALLEHQHCGHEGCDHDH